MQKCSIIAVIILLPGRQIAQERPAAIAGFNFNDSSANVMRPVKYFNLPNSGTDAIEELTRTSNVGITGLWIFRVDENEIGSEFVTNT